jgi:hypothetical protein
LFSSRQRLSFASSGVCWKKVSHCVWTTETFRIDERGYTRSNGVDLYMCFGVWFSFSPTLADGDDDEYMCCWQKWAVDGHSLLKSAFGNQSVVSVLCLPRKNAAESLLCVYWHWMLKSYQFLHCRMIYGYSTMQPYVSGWWRNREIMLELLPCA